jgi:lipoyl(octanoyl) transferase
LIEPEPRSGVWNMALDEALLEAALERGVCTVRWYRWDRATVSLGYFQQTDSIAAQPELADCPVVRRLSGGGAILHHHEWTYSCTVPPDHRLAGEPGRLYEVVHQRIIAVLAEQGIGAMLRGAAQPGRDAAFLCFGRGDPRDVVIRGNKIVGSAQRRRRGAILQHGSVLLRASEFAPQFPGLLDLAERAQLDGGFPGRVGELCAQLFGSVDVASEPDPLTTDRCRALLPRYRTLDWGRGHHAATDSEPSISS